MLQGLYAAATGIMAVEDQQAVIANNIANASTVGFRRQAPIQKGFYDTFVTELRRPFWFNTQEAPGGGVKVVETFTDVSAGTLTRTEDPLNVALQGPGFVVVDTPNGERFTRSGKFSVDLDGQLATVDGFKVQNADGGGIDVRGGTIEILADGAVNVDGAPTGRIRLVEFEDPHVLTREGHYLYAASDAAAVRSAEAADTQVVQQALEASNVNLPHEMVNMIVGLRAYAANQKVINAMDETVSRLIERVGMPV